MGRFKDAEDTESIMPVLRGWLAVLGAAGVMPLQAQQRHGERPRWRQPPRLVWNALCTLLPLLAAPALEHVVRQMKEAVAIITEAAVTGSQNQCACCWSNEHRPPPQRKLPAHVCMNATTATIDRFALIIRDCNGASLAACRACCTQRRG